MSVKTKVNFKRRFVFEHRETKELVIIRAVDSTHAWLTLAERHNRFDYVRQGR